MEYFLNFGFGAKTLSSSQVFEIVFGGKFLQVTLILSELLRLFHARVKYEKTVELSFCVLFVLWIKI